jgi:hypothetical protein
MTKPYRSAASYDVGPVPDLILESEVSASLIYGNGLVDKRVMGDPVTGGVRNLQAHLRAAHDERMLLRRVCMDLQEEVVSARAREDGFKREIKSLKALIQVLDEHALERAAAKRRLPRFVWRWLIRNPQ